MAFRKTGLCRLSSMEAGVKLVINALGIDTVSRLLDREEK